MSHALGEVWTPAGELLGYFEYNGTVDITCTRIYESEDELFANWRADNFRDCQCQNEDVPVILYTNYGGGFYWNGDACLVCKAITGGMNVYDDGHPFPEKE